MVHALFPNGSRDLIRYFAIWADERMIEALNEYENFNDMRIRDKVKTAVAVRIDVLAPHKEAVSLCFKNHVLRPQNARLSVDITWTTASRIWDFIGDTSADYNYYTKRGLLSGVIASTMIFWLQDQSEAHEKTSRFLENRIDNVLFIGKTAGKIINPLASFAQSFTVPSNPFKKNKA
jgi:ubiquinone biosynthesis protein COQ9